MRIEIDSLGRIELIDDYKPYGSLLFEINRDRVAIYQSAQEPEVRSEFETINESAEFNKAELIVGLSKITELLKGEAHENKRTNK